MSAADWIVLAVIFLIVGGATAYIIKAKKSGKKCIGCPDRHSCKKGNCGSCNGSRGDE